MDLTAAEKRVVQAALGGSAVKTVHRLSKPMTEMEFIGLLLANRRMFAHLETPHPHGLTLKTRQEGGAMYLETSEEGRVIATVEFKTDGNYAALLSNGVQVRFFWVRQESHKCTGDATPWFDPRVSQKFEARIRPAVKRECIAVMPLEGPHTRHPLLMAMTLMGEAPPCVMLAQFNDADSAPAALCPYSVM